MAAAGRVAILAAVVSGGFAFAASATAAPAVRLEPGTVTLVSSGGGTHAATVVLRDSTAARFAVSAGVPDDPGCSVAPSPAVIGPGRTTVTLTLGRGCTVDGGVNVTLRLPQNAAPRPIVVVAEPPAPPAPPQWSILVWSFVAGLAAALGVALLLVVKILIHNRRPEGKDRTEIGWGTELKGLGTDWSFKDNWLGSITVVAGALVTLLGTSGVLKAVLGSEPEAALSVIIVSGALAAVFVAIGPVLVKLIGKSLAVPTAGGTIVAAVVTLFGAMSEISTVTWQGRLLASSWDALPVVVTALGVGVGSVVLWYAVKALWEYLAAGAVAARVPGNSLL